MSIRKRGRSVAARAAAVAVAPALLTLGFLLAGVLVLYFFYVASLVLYAAFFGAT